LDLIGPRQAAKCVDLPGDLDGSAGKLLVDDEFVVVSIAAGVVDHLVGVGPEPEFGFLDAHGIDIAEAAKPWRAMGGDLLEPTRVEAANFLPIVAEQPAIAPGVEET